MKFGDGSPQSQKVYHLMNLKQISKACCFTNANLLSNVNLFKAIQLSITNKLKQLFEVFDLANLKKIDTNLATHHTFLVCDSLSEWGYLIISYVLRRLA